MSMRLTHIYIMGMRLAHIYIKSIRLGHIYIMTMRLGHIMDSKIVLVTTSQNESSCNVAL